MSRPETVDDARTRTQLRDVERRICDLTTITIGVAPNVKGGRVDDLKGLCVERRRLQTEMALAATE